MKTAKYLRNLEGWRGDARVYELSEPYCDTTLVIVSAVAAEPFLWVPGGPETFIFPATVESLEFSEPSDWGELEGSFQGDLDHERALRNAGYEVQ